jgi:hypothetical protein
MGHHSVLYNWFSRKVRWDITVYCAIGSAGRYGGASQCSVQLGLQEGTVGHHSVLCNWVCRKVRWGITVYCAIGSAVRYRSEDRREVK